jgi:cytidylate kinase
MHAMTDERSFLRRLVVAIDGPAGSGKTTTARGVAENLGLRHVDTGAMYRAVTWKTLQSGTDPSDEARVAEISRTIDIRLSREGTGAEKISAGGVDVTDAIRTLEVTRHVSLVSSYPAVRRSMVRLQRHLAREGGVVLEGRDIGSVVLPGAHVKVFLQASVDERARRRVREIASKGVEKTFEEIRSDIERRDRLDSTRETSPLKIAVGAHVVDTTALTIEEEVRKIVEIARSTASSLASLAVPGGEKNPRAAQRTVYAATCAVIRSLARALFGLRVVGRDGPELAENYIYASNHRSNADPPIVGSALAREVHFMAKKNLFEKPLFGRLIRYYNAIPTRRESFDREAFGTATELLQRGGSLLIFPEGTRSRGAGFGDVKPGVGYLALTTRVPVLPVYARGTGRLGDALRRREPLAVVFGDPIRAPNPETAQPTADNCREFARMVMAAIESLRDEIEPAPL